MADAVGSIAATLSGQVGVNRVARSDGSVETLGHIGQAEMLPGDVFEICTSGGAMAPFSAPSITRCTMRYANSAGVQRMHPAWQALTHFFNHQAHHRGQVTTLLMQAGVDPGVTDLIAML